MVELDEVDRKILRLLVAGADSSLTEIGEQVGLSTTALHHRIKNLKKRKVIQRFTIALSEAVYEGYVSCFVKVIKTRKSSIELSQKFRSISEVEACYSVAGEESLLLKVRSKSTKDFHTVLEQINKIDGVERTISSLIIEEHFNKGQTV